MGSIYKMMSTRRSIHTKPDAQQTGILAGGSVLPSAAEASESAAENATKEPRPKLTTRKTFIKMANGELAHAPVQGGAASAYSDCEEGPTPLLKWLSMPTEPLSLISHAINIGTLPFRWMVHTSKGVVGVDDAEIRGRIVNQAACLGGVAALYLVIAIQATLMPPIPLRVQNGYNDYEQPTDWEKLLIDVYGVCMFTSTTMLVSYLTISLTVVYPG